MSSAIISDCTRSLAAFAYADDMSIQITEIIEQSDRKLSLAGDDRSHAYRNKASLRKGCVHSDVEERDTKK